jgi:hypothetical protein
MLVDVGHHDAPDLHRLPVAGHDVGEGRVLRSEAQRGASLVQSLAGELTVHDRHHDVAVPRLDRPVDQHNGSIQDAGALHRVSLDAHEEGGLGVANQLAHELDPVDLVVFGRGWKARSHTHPGGLQPDVGHGQGMPGGQRVGHRAHGANTVYMYSIITEHTKLEQRR